MASEHGHYGVLGWVLLSAYITASTTECAGFKNHCGSQRFREPSASLISAQWMLPAYFYEFLESSHSGPSLVSPPPQQFRPLFSSKVTKNIAKPSRFVSFLMIFQQQWIPVPFLSFAILLIPLLACSFPSSSSSFYRWNWLPLAVSFLYPQSEMRTNEYIASRHPFFLSLCLSSASCTILLGIELKLSPPPLDYHTTKLTGFPPGTLSVPRIRRVARGLLIPA